jgi:hypothetical protein
VQSTNYIKEIGKNRWISLFKDKLLPKVCEIIDNYKKKKNKIKNKKSENF